MAEKVRNIHYVNLAVAFGMVAGGAPIRWKFWLIGWIIVTNATTAILPWMRRRIVRPIARWRMYRSVTKQENIYEKLFTGPARRRLAGWMRYDVFRYTREPRRR